MTARATALALLATALLAGCGASPNKHVPPKAPPAVGTSLFVNTDVGIALRYPVGWQVQKLTKKTFLFAGGPNTTCRVDVGPGSARAQRDPLFQLRSLLRPVLSAGSDRKLISSVEPLTTARTSGSTAVYRVGPNDVRAGFFANRRIRVIVNCVQATASFRPLDRRAFVPLVRTVTLSP